jgi:hypothetical protein
MFRDLRRQLLARAMPMVEVRRYIRELRDHHSDLVGEEIAAGMSPEDARLSASNRLGELKQLASAAIESFTRRTFVGRHPLFFYGFTPLFVAILLFAVALMPSMTFQKSALVHHWFPIYGRTIFYIIPGILSPIYYRDAWQRALGLAWRLLPSVLICTMAFFLVLAIKPWNAGWQVGLGMRWHVNFFSGLIPILTTFLLARYLGPKQFRNPLFLQRVKS